ncbi:MAG: hypothetical protein M5U14_05420 [Acidimicrobiia bacterium]|nr:hypothetical protein [Acidimicrobiia bacterium]
MQAAHREPHPNRAHLVPAGFDRRRDRGGVGDDGEQRPRRHDEEPRPQHGQRQPDRRRGHRERQQGPRPHVRDLRSTPGDRLERRPSHVAVVDDRPEQRWEDRGAPVDEAGPARLAQPVEPVRVGAGQHLLRPPVPALLPEVAADGPPPVVSHLGRRGEGDLLAPVEQLPAHVDVVARRGVGGIEATDPLERRPAVGHVAARHVLGPVVRHEHLGRAPR